MTHFTKEQWARIPLPLKSRWWKDTDYGAHEPLSPSLLQMWWLVRDGYIDSVRWDAVIAAFDYENETVAAKEAGE